MQKLNTMAVNHLISFNRTDQYASMNSQQKKSFIFEIKKQAAYHFLTANQAVQMKDYKTAKDTLIFIADSCFCISDPDDQVRYLIEVCCQNLACIYELENDNNLKKEARQAKNKKRTQLLKSSSYAFIYNNISGQFECTNENRKTLSKNVLFYMSKLNGILLNYQKERIHSVISMLQTYYPFFLMVIFLILILVAMVFSGMIQSALHLQDGSIYSQLPIILCCSLFLFPLFKIYSKSPVKKDSAFFAQKLGKEISKINTLCARKGENITFFMPEGTQIDVLVGKDLHIRT